MNARESGIETWLGIREHFVLLVIEYVCVHIMRVVVMLSFTGYEFSIWLSSTHICEENISG